MLGCKRWYLWDINWSFSPCPLSVSWHKLADIHRALWGLLDQGCLCRNGFKNFTPTSSSFLDHAILDLRALNVFIWAQNFCMGGASTLQVCGPDLGPFISTLGVHQGAGPSISLTLLFWHLHCGILKQLPVKRIVRAESDKVTLTVQTLQGFRLEIVTWSIRV